MPRVVVLAAGLGTRLRPLTDELPKSLVPIGDRPLIAHVLEYLRAHGFEQAIINTHHLASAYEPMRSRLPLAVKLNHEGTIRGTAGGVSAVRHLLAPAPILVWNADTLAAPPLVDLLRLGQEGLCLAIAPRPLHQGTVGIDAEGQVVRLRGERFGVEFRGGDYVGVAALGTRCLDSLPPLGCLIGDWALPELRRGGRIRTVDCLAPWIDVGSLASYVTANRDWLERRGWESWRAQTAELNPGIELVCSLVGEGAKVGGSGRVQGCVIWPGAEARAPLADAIVLSSGRVVRHAGSMAGQG